MRLLPQDYGITPYEAKVDFVDIDPQTINMCPVELEQKLIKASKEGKLPKIVIPVHFVYEKSRVLM